MDMWEQKKQITAIRKQVAEYTLAIKRKETMPRIETKDQAVNSFVEDLRVALKDGCRDECCTATKRSGGLVHIKIENWRYTVTLMEVERLKEAWERIDF